MWFAVWKYMSLLSKHFIMRAFPITANEQWTIPSMCSEIICNHSKWNGLSVAEVCYWRAMPSYFCIQFWFVRPHSFISIALFVSLITSKDRHFPHFDFSTQELWVCVLFLSQTIRRSAMKHCDSLKKHGFNRFSPIQFNSRVTVSRAKGRFSWEYWAQSKSLSTPLAVEFYLSMLFQRLQHSVWLWVMCSGFKVAH